MINVIDIAGNQGVTVGQRKDGSRAVLYSDNNLVWFSAEEFSNLLAEVIR